MVARLSLLLGRIPAGAVMTSALALIGLLSFIDLVTGPRISFSIFYLLPIFLVTWRCGRWPGFAASLISAVAWLLADTVEDYSHSLIPYWNALVRLAFFLLTAYFVSELKTTEDRRRTLERIFFHDILNVAGSIRGFTELLQAHPDIDRKEIYRWLQAAVEQSIEQIETQRALTAVEHGDLPIMPSPLNSLEIMDQVSQFYRHHPAGENRHIVLAASSESVSFVCDQILLHRILGNMVKNALEASPTGSAVTIACREHDDGVEFRVHNCGVVPADVREQIFTRTVTARGAGRGLGTYSIQVLSQYLGGFASFSTSQQEGTTFRVWLPRRCQRKS